jgi:hypothetical protein
MIGVLDKYNLKCDRRHHVSLFVDITTRCSNNIIVALPMTIVI